MTEDSLLPFDLPAVRRKKVTADFGGGLISSDGGVVLLREAERRLGLAETLAGCIREWRDPATVVHTLPAMLRFRMFAIACGYEDADDCDALRTDPLFKLAARWPITKIMSSDGCNGNRVPLEMGSWYDFREFGCHLENVGLAVRASLHAVDARSPPPSRQATSRRITMRTHSSTALSVVAAAIVAASSVAAAPYDAELKQRYEAAKAEGKVVMYSVESIELIQELADAFKARFPGIDFDFFRGDSTQIAQRFEAETAAGRHLSDVLMLTATDSENMTRDGLLLDTNSPVAKSYPAGTQPTNGYWYNYGLNTVGFAYNTDLVKPSEAPKTWEDLLDPKWKGKIGMQDPKSGGGGAHAWVARMYQVYGEERWFEFMDRMGGQIGKFGRYFPIRESLASGEIAIQLAAYPDYTEPLKIKGAPIDWGTPTPMFFVGLTVQANKSAPHPNAARLVVDFILTPEAQKIIGGTGKIPADPANRPGGFARLNDAMMEPMDANRLWSIHSKDWFNERIRKYFAAGR